MPETAAELLECPAADAADTDAGEIAEVENAHIIAADLLVEEISIDGMCGVY